MALQHLRSSTADKRPTPAAMSDGQLALNTNLVSPGLFFKDSNGDSVKIGPVHVGTTAPNVTPGAGGQAGNSKGEAWLDTTAANPILKVFNGSAFVAVQPVGTGTVVSTTDTGTVTSTMILDGTILNADINASAAIVDTKLATIATGGKVSNSATTATDANTASAIVARDASGNFTAGTITAALTGAASSNVLKAGDTMTGELVHPLGAAATPSLTFTGDLNTGVFSPGADQVAVATNGTQRLTVDTAATTSTLPVVHPLGAVGTPSITFTGDLNTGIYSPTADTIAFSEGGVEVMRIDSSGRVGIGTTSPGNINTTQVTSDNDGIRLQSQTTPVPSQGPRLIFGHSTNNGTQQIFAAIKSLIASGNDVTWNSDLAFYIGGSSLAECLRIDSSGRLLVGTSSARTNMYNNIGIGSNLQVEGTGYTSSSSTLICNNTNSSIFSTLNFCKSAGSSVGSNTLVPVNSYLGQISFQGNDGSDFVSGAEIAAYVDDTPSANDMPGRLVFSTTANGASSPTERMRITSNNQQTSVLIGTQGGIGSASGTLQVKGTGAEGLTVQGGTNNFIATWHNTSGTLIGSITGSGGAGVAYNTSSDYRLKENVIPLTDATNRLQQLLAYRFNFIDDASKTVDGFLAHEVQAVVPEAITGEKDAVDADGNPKFQGIDQSKLVPLLTAALQEAMERIETLEASNTDLLARVSALESA